MDGRKKTGQQGSSVVVYFPAMKIEAGVIRPGDSSSKAAEPRVTVAGPATFYGKNAGSVTATQSVSVNGQVVYEESAVYKPSSPGK